MTVDDYTEKKMVFGAGMNRMDEEFTWPIRSPPSVFRSVVFASESFDAFSGAKNGTRHPQTKQQQHCSTAICHNCSAALVSSHALNVRIKALREREHFSFRSISSTCLIAEWANKSTERHSPYRIKVPRKKKEWRKPVPRTFLVFLFHIWRRTLAARRKTLMTFF